MATPTPPPEAPPPPPKGLSKSALSKLEAIKARKLMRALDAVDVWLSHNYNYTQLAKHLDIHPTTARGYVTLVQDYWLTKAAELLHPAKMEQLRRMILYRQRLLEEYEKSRGRRVVTKKSVGVPQLDAKGAKTGVVSTTQATQEETVEESGDVRLLQLVLECDRNIVGLLGPMARGAGQGEEYDPHGVQMGHTTRLEVLIKNGDVKKAYLPPIPIPENHVKVLPPALIPHMPGSGPKNGHGGNGGT